jgi:hypothetical protein
VFEAFAPPPPRRNLRTDGVSRHEANTDQNCGCKDHFDHVVLRDADEMTLRQHLVQRNMAGV